MQAIFFLSLKFYSSHRMTCLSQEFKAARGARFRASPAGHQFGLIMDSSDLRLSDFLRDFKILRDVRAAGGMAKIHTQKTNRSRLLVEEQNFTLSRNTGAQ
jgi:hypothetical protein